MVCQVYFTGHRRAHRIDLAAISLLHGGRALQ